MSNDILVKAAMQRQEAFNNIKAHLEKITNTIRKLDPKAKVYLFGSATEIEHNYSSDIDVLIITELYPAKVHAELWKAGVREPFEIHVHTRREAEFFKRRTTLTKV